MNLDDKVRGLPMGLMPEEGTLKHKNWLEDSIKGLYVKFKSIPDSILTEQYLGEINLYMSLYGGCYTGKDQ